MLKEPKVMRTIEPSQAVRHQYRDALIRIERRIDHDNEGQFLTVPIALVPLPCGGTAILELEAFEELMRQGFSDQWWAHPNGNKHAYVRTTHVAHGGRMFTVARLLAGGEHFTRTRYLDKNPLNLRVDNLKVGEGYSKGSEAFVMMDPANQDF